MVLASASTECVSDPVSSIQKQCAVTAGAYCMRREAGKVQAFGIATWNCFRVPPSDPGHLSLQEVWDIAAKAGGKNHGFRQVKMLLQIARQHAEFIHLSSQAH